MTLADARPAAARKRRDFRLKRGDKIIAFTLFFGLLALLLWPFTFFIIRPGEVGVLFRVLTTGTETTFVYREGLGIKWPWNTIYRYEVRTQAQEERVHGLAHDGLSINIDVTVLFRPQAEKAGVLHQQVGPDYVERLVKPLTIEAVRAVIGKFGPHDLYRIEVSKLERDILLELQDSPVDLITYQGVVIRNIDLPDTLNTAITNKLTQEQNAQAYEYIIDQEKKEAERKRIEAVGIQTFYSIVADALSPQLLTWRGIEATVQIARSNNSKVVIVGGGKDQLPLILGSDIATQPNMPAPPAVDPETHRLPSFDGLPPLFPTRPGSPGSTSEAPAPRDGSRETSQTAGPSDSDATGTGTARPEPASTRVPPRQPQGTRDGS